MSTKNHRSTLSFLYAPHRRHNIGCSSPSGAGIVGVSFDPDGEIVSYVWTLDDVEIAAGAIAEVQLGVGVHEVTLTVTDDDGAVGVDSVVVTVG